MKRVCPLAMAIALALPSVAGAAEQPKQVSLDLGKGEARGASSRILRTHGRGSIACSAPVLNRLLQGFELDAALDLGLQDLVLQSELLILECQRSTRQPRHRGDQRQTRPVEALIRGLLHAILPETDQGRAARG